MKMRKRITMMERRRRRRKLVCLSVSLIIGSIKIEGLITMKRMKVIIMIMISTMEGGEEETFSVR